MTVRRAASVAALALVLAAPSARAEELRPAAQRVAASLLQQLAARPPRPAVSALTVAPLKESGAAAAGQGAAFSAAVAEALAASGKVQVRDWSAFDTALRDKALATALGGTPGIPPLERIQAMVVGEIGAPPDGGPLRVTARLLLLPSGAVAASEGARVDPAAAAPPQAARAAVESASVDVAMRRIADQLAAGFARLPGNARYRRLAVLAFSETGPEAKRRELGAVVAAELSTNLRRDHGLLLVERDRLGSVLAEAKLGAMGLTDPRTAPKLGELADAQALVVGSVSDAGGRFLVNARILSAESAETLAAASESIPAATLVALSADAVVLRSRGDAVFRSLLVPGLGQAYNRQPAKGAVFAGTTALLAGGAVAFHFAAAAKTEAYRDYRPAAGTADPGAAAAALRDEAQTRLRWRNGLALSAAAIWLVNVADAYLSGVDGGAVAVAPAPLPGGGVVAVAGRF